MKKTLKKKPKEKKKDVVDVWLEFFDHYKAKHEQRL
jgi:hypothetical protein